MIETDEHHDRVFLWGLKNLTQYGNLVTDSK
jgi:hypothetical protein